MKNQSRHLAGRIFLKRDLSVDFLEKKLGWRLGEYLNLWLPGSLHVERRTFAGDRDVEVWSELVHANIGLDHCRIDGDLRANLEGNRRREWSALVEQMEPDVVRRDHLVR